MLIVPRKVIWFAVASILWFGDLPAGLAQTDTDEPAQAVSAEQRQLERCREGIFDPDLQDKDRRRWSELLLSYRTAESTALALDLLGRSDRPEVQRVLCGVIADRTVPKSERLNDAFVTPLIVLLGAESAELRSVAAQALADFSSNGVSEKLGKLAARPDAPLEKRLAAIDALTPNTHRREVVEQLVQLLNTEDTEIIERIVVALAPLVPQSFGNEVTHWRVWWAAKSELDSETWLEEQLQFQRDRRRRVEDELERFRSASGKREQAATARSGVFQRELYRAFDDEQREIKLTEWLDDPLSHVKRAALSIIKERMGDEGKRPTGDVLSSLLARLSDESPRIRRDALEIAQTIADASVADAILARLDREKDRETRCALFEALGKLDNPGAVEALVGEIDAKETVSLCVPEAALALGQIAEKANIADRYPEAVNALSERYEAASAEDAALRTALLSAMVGVADPSFSRAFLDAVDSDNPRVLREAVRGLRALGDTSKLPRLRTLTDHPDALVRLEATATIGHLGREEADLERLLVRLSAATESNAAVREMAWQGLREFFGRRPAAERIAAADRLRHAPELELKYLEELVDDLASMNVTGSDRERALDLLADALLRQSRYAEAAQRLQALYELQRGQSSSISGRTGLRLLDARLRSGANPHVADLIRELAASDDASTKTEIIRTLSTHLDELPAGGAKDRLEPLVREMKTISTDLFGPEWIVLVERIEALRGTVDPPTNPTATPPTKPESNGA